MTDLLQNIGVFQYLDIFIIIGLLCIGALIKHLLPKIPNKYIPYILLVLSFVYYILKTILGDGEVDAINNVVNAIITSACSIGIHSSGKGLIKIINKSDKILDAISDDIKNEIEEAIKDDTDEDNTSEE